MTAVAPSDVDLDNVIRNYVDRTGIFPEYVSLSEYAHYAIVASTGFARLFGGDVTLNIWNGVSIRIDSEQQQAFKIVEGVIK